MGECVCCVLGECVCECVCSFCDQGKGVRTHTHTHAPFATTTWAWPRQWVQAQRTAQGVWPQQEQRDERAAPPASNAEAPQLGGAGRVRVRIGGVGPREF